MITIFLIKKRNYVNGCRNLLFFAAVVILSACNPPDHAQTQQNKSKSQLQQQFKQWEAQQDPKLLAEYYQFMSQYLKNPPSLMELTTSRNNMPERCYSKRFAIPPKRYWKNVVSSLQLVEKLNRNEFFKRYTITAIYRTPELNKCINGAEKSQHLYLYAVDFHVLDPKETSESDRNLLLKKMCQFWKVEGKHFKMGLGVYGNNRYHIDTQAYRTWGKDFKSTSSACLKN